MKKKERHLTVSTKTKIGARRGEDCKSRNGGEGRVTRMRATRLKGRGREERTKRNEAIFEGAWLTSCRTVFLIFKIKTHTKQVCVCVCVYS